MVRNLLATLSMLTDPVLFDQRPGVLPHALPRQRPHWYSGPDGKRKLRKCVGASWKQEWLPHRRNRNVRPGNK